MIVMDGSTLSTIALDSTAGGVFNFGVDGFVDDADADTDMRGSVSSPMKESIDSIAIVSTEVAFFPS